MSVIKIKMPKIAASYGNSKTATTASATQLIDSTGAFTTQGVQAGDLIYKYAPASGNVELFVVDTIDSETTITFETNSASFGVGDKYVILRTSETQDFYIDPNSIHIIRINNSSANGSYFEISIPTDDNTENELRLTYYKKSNIELNVPASSNVKMINKFISVMDKCLKNSYTKTVEFNPVSDVGMLFYRLL